MKSSHQEERKDRAIAATALAIAESVLTICARHALVVLSVEDADIRDAYRLSRLDSEAAHHHFLPFPYSTFTDHIFRAG